MLACFLGLPWCFCSKRAKQKAAKKAQIPPPHAYDSLRAKARPAPVRSPVCHSSVAASVFLNLCRQGYMVHTVRYSVVSKGLYNGTAYGRARLLSQWPRPHSHRRKRFCQRSASCGIHLRRRRRDKRTPAAGVEGARAPMPRLWLRPLRARSDRPRRSAIKTVPVLVLVVLVGVCCHRSIPRCPLTPNKAVCLRWPATLTVCLTDFSCNCQ